MYLTQLNHEKLFSWKVSACSASLIRLEGLLRVRVIHMLKQNNQLLPQISSERLQQLPMAKKMFKERWRCLVYIMPRFIYLFFHGLISLRIWVKKISIAGSILNILGHLLRMSSGNPERCYPEKIKTWASAAPVSWAQRTYPGKFSWSQRNTARL